VVQRALLDTRLAARRALAGLAPTASGGEGSLPLVLVALSGGADSLALAVAMASEAPAFTLRAGAIVVDHGLQQGSADVAARAAEQARSLGLEPVLVRRVRVQDDPGRGGPEAAAREARYEAFVDAAASSGAVALLTAHTRDDQAEQVLLALARGSGARSLAGIPPKRELVPGISLVRPFLGELPSITRAVTEAACAEAGLMPWRDPHNEDSAYTRVRVRRELLPEIERVLGPGVRESLARSADLAREDAEALDALAALVVGAAREVPTGQPDVDAAGVRIDVDAAVDPCGVQSAGADAAAGVRIDVSVLAAQPAAIRNRAIRMIAERWFGAHLGREHTLAVAALVTSWRGQGPVFVPGLRVMRREGGLVFVAQVGSPRR